MADLTLASPFCCPCTVCTLARHYPNTFTSTLHAPYLFSSSNQYRYPPTLCPFIPPPPPQPSSINASAHAPTKLPKYSGGRGGGGFILRFSHFGDWFNILAAPARVATIFRICLFSWTWRTFVVCGPEVFTGVNVWHSAEDLIIYGSYFNIA
jgi:hypothetical protein